MVVKLSQNVTHDGKLYENGAVIENISDEQAKRLVKLGVADFIEQYHVVTEFTPASNEGREGHENDPSSNTDDDSGVKSLSTIDENLDEDEAASPPPSIDEEIDEQSEFPKPKHIGGGVYELPNGERIKGKTEAYKAWDKLNEDV